MNWSSEQSEGATHCSMLSCEALSWDRTSSNSLNRFGSTLPQRVDFAAAGGPNFPPTAN